MIPGREAKILHALPAKKPKHKDAASIFQQVRLQPPSAVILEPPKIKSVTVSTVSPSICHEVIGLDAMILVFES